MAAAEWTRLRDTCWLPNIKGDQQRKGERMEMEDDKEREIERGG